MKVKAGQEKDYEKFVEVNSHDFYSYGVITYMNRWVELMEKEIEQGKKVEEIADYTSRAADTDGITGFMFGCAVNALSKFWEYGEDLEKWRKKEYKC